jgi:glycosyltransferase involved in cell wall biosynthesis
LGNDVTLFASGDSTSAKLDATWPKALRLDGSVRDPNALHMVMLERVRQKCDDEEFDFLHFHLDYYPFSLFSRQPTPFLTTLHGRLDLPEHQPVFTPSLHVPVISISNAQRRPVPQANWMRTIHHGLPENLLTPQPVKPGYLAVLGRIAPEKGVDRAIRIAIRCGIPLKIAAKVDRADQEYYDEMIRPLIEAPAGRIHPRRDAPELCMNLSPENRGRGECRVPNAPAASRAKVKKAHERSHHRFTGFTRHSRTQWF